jgi:glycerophosphoryl diester phosphodiesterase
MTRERKKIWAIAHRGDSLRAPENTAIAFTRATNADVDAIECDIRLSKDGIPFICHDATLQRFGGPMRSVRAMTMKELLRYDVGAWKGGAFRGQTLMTLRALLQQFTHKTWCLEIKATAGRGAERYHRQVVAAVVQVIRRCKKQNNVFILCFHAGVLQLVKKMAPELRTVRNCEKLPSNRRVWLEQQHEHAAVCFDRRLVDKALVAQAHELGLLVFAYSANDKRAANALINCGVDGILSDDSTFIVNHLRGD